MSIDLGGTAADAWALWRRDRAVLLPVAGLLLFVPTLALLLFVAGPPSSLGPSPSDADTAQFFSSYRAWVGANAPYFLSGAIVSAFGTLTILSFYLDRASATLGDAMVRALALLPRYLLASVLVLLPAAIGLLLLVVPGLYVLGRLILVGPVLVAEQPVSALDAVSRGFALSNRHGLVLAGVVTIALVAQQLLPAPLLAIDETLRGMRAANPVVILVVDAMAAALATGASLGLLLFKVALYRRLA